MGKKSDPHEQSGNGKKLMEVIEDNDLIIVNGTDLCEGLITRKRNFDNSIENSVIDFFIVCRRFFQMIIYMKIDEANEHTLTIYSIKKWTKEKM